MVKTLHYKITLITNSLVLMGSRRWAFDWYQNRWPWTA